MDRVQELSAFLDRVIGEEGEPRYEHVTSPMLQKLATLPESTQNHTFSRHLEPRYASLKAASALPSLPQNTPNGSSPFSPLSAVLHRSFC